MKFILTCIFLGLTALARGQGLNMLYNFANNPHWFNGYCSSAVTDTNYFIVTGATSDDSLSLSHTFVARFNYQGQLQWQDNMPYFQYSTAAGYSCMARQSTGTIVMSAVSLDSNLNHKIAVYQPFLYFFDANDSIRKVVSFIDSNTSRYANSIAIDNNDNIIAAGQITSNHIEYVPYYDNYIFDSLSIGLFKYNSNGQLLWQKKCFPIYNDTNADIFLTVNKIIISSDNNSYLITGAIQDDTLSSVKTFLMKTDTAGNVIWYKYLPYNAAFGMPRISPSAYNADIMAAKGGGYYFTSSNTFYVDSIYQNYLYYGKLDENGDIIWGKNYYKHAPPKAYHSGLHIAYSTDGNLLLSGQYDDLVYNPTLLKTDTLGNEIWYREQAYINTFQPVQNLYTLTTVPDGRILETGSFYLQFAQPFFDTSGSLSWIVLTDSLGQRYPGDTLLENYLTVQPIPTINIKIALYPNPVTSQLYINTYNQAGITLQLTDISGRVLLSTPLQAGVNPVAMQQYNPGIYIAKMYNNGQLLKVQKISKY